MLTNAYGEQDNNYMNSPSWDILYRAEYTGSDSFQLDHKTYYEPYLKEFEQGMAREDFLHDLAYRYKTLERLKKEETKNRTK